MAISPGQTTSVPLSCAHLEFICFRLDEHDLCEPIPLDDLMFDVVDGFCMPSEGRGAGMGKSHAHPWYFTCCLDATSEDRVEDDECVRLVVGAPVGLTNLLAEEMHISLVDTRGAVQLEATLPKGGALEWHGQNSLPYLPPSLPPSLPS